MNSPFFRIESLGLNPCFNGILKYIYAGPSVGYQYCVLILVLMEY